jgi:hypothetical protein
MAFARGGIVLSGDELETEMGGVVLITLPSGF